MLDPLDPRRRLGMWKRLLLVAALAVLPLSRDGTGAGAADLQ
jgi:hypothetical protein